MAVCGVDQNRHHNKARRKIWAEAPGFVARPGQKSGLPAYFLAYFPA